MLFNEIYTPIFEINKLIKPYERSRNEENDIINKFKHNAKTHLPTKEKIHSSLHQTFTYSSDQGQMAHDQDL